MKKIIYLLFNLTLLFACNKDETATNAIGNDGVGTAGSTARFTIIGDYLYTVDNQNLNVFEISNPSKPSKISITNIGRDIETIFPRDENTLFVGSQSGIFIYDVTNPLLIKELGSVSHFRACDPVVANKNYAFVTLNNEGSVATRNCWGNINQLITYDITDYRDIKTLKVYNLTKPKGLGLKGNNLFVCDNLLRWYDASNPSNLISINNFAITAHDIIPLDSSLILVGDGGITQLGFANDSIWYLSKIQTKIK